MSSKLRKCLQKQPLAAQHIGELKAEQSHISLLFPISFGCAEKAKYYGLSPLFSEQRASVLGCSDIPMTGELATCWGLQAWY